MANTVGVYLKLFGKITERTAIVTEDYIEATGEDQSVSIDVMDVSDFEGEDRRQESVDEEMDTPPTPRPPSRPRRPSASPDQTTGGKNYNQQQPVYQPDYKNQDHQGPQMLADRTGGRYNKKQPQYQPAHEPECQEPQRPRASARSSLKQPWKHDDSEAYFSHENIVSLRYIDYNSLW